MLLYRTLGTNFVPQQCLKEQCTEQVLVLHMKTYYRVGLQRDSLSQKYYVLF